MKVNTLDVDPIKFMTMILIVIITPFLCVHAKLDFGDLCGIFLLTSGYIMFSVENDLVTENCFMFGSLVTVEAAITSAIT